MESLRLVIEMLDRIDEAERTEQQLNLEAEAKRLLRRHPKADVDEEEVAEVLREEIAAGSIM